MIVDQNAHANQQFEAFHTFWSCLLMPSTPPTKPPVYWALAILPVPAAAPAIQGPAPWAPAVAKISIGVPIDIDTARREGGVPTSMCCHCRKPRHWACSCMEGLDMCYLLVNKQHVLIMELPKDAIGVLSPEVMDRMSGCTRGFLALQ